MTWIAVAIGGALGSVARHGVNVLVGRLVHRPVPYATAAVNLAGCVVIGVLAGLLASGRLQMSMTVRAFVFVGVLGGFTTFSSFGLDTFTLAREELEYAFDGARAAWQAAGRTTPPRLVTGCWFALGPNGRAQMDDYLGRYLGFLGPSAAGLIPLVPTVDAQGLRDAVARARDAGADEIVLAPTTLDPNEIERVQDLLF